MAEHGPKMVRDSVAALLEADLPPRIDAMTELWALDRSAIPWPKVVSGEAADDALDHSADHWIEVITPRLMPRTRTVGMTAEGEQIHRYRYSARIYLWVLADTWQEALDRRDRLTTAGHDSLLTYPTLAIPPMTGDTGFLLHINTISKEFAAPVRIGARVGGSPRVRSAALLAYEIEHEYATGYPRTLPPWGTMNNYELSVTLLPFAPVGG